MRVFYISFLMLLSTVSIGAQTLDECRRLAREHYPEIRQYNLVTRTERSSISVVRDFGAIHCPPTAKFLRSKNAHF
jgi:hypothetical protein